MWPWVKRETLTAAVARAAWAEQNLRVAEERAAAAQQQMADAQAEHERERQKLLDRILQLSGQPALYAPAPEPAKAAAPDGAPGSVLPPARRMVDLSEIHAAARDAMVNGEFTPKQGRVF